MVLRQINKFRADGIALDVAATLEVIAFFGDSGASKALLKDVTDETVGLLEMACVG